MKQDGFTLIELLVIVTIISILTIALGFEFVGWMARYRTESQIKTMQLDLMSARQRAMEKNIQYVVQFPAGNTSYVICEDNNPNNNVCDAAETTTNISRALSKNGLRYQMNSNLGAAVIVMNTRGMVMTSVGGAAPAGIDSTLPNAIWLLNPATGLPYINVGVNQDFAKVDYDCISLTSTRIGVGKYDATTIPPCTVK